MIQEITAYLIIALSFAWTIYKFIRSLDVFKKKSSSACSSCASGGCTGCAFNTAPYQLSPVHPPQATTR